MKALLVSANRASLNVPSIASADPALIQPGKNLLAYIRALPTLTSNKVMSGEIHLNDCQTVFNESGRFPAIVGNQIIDAQHGSFGQVSAGDIADIKTHWNNGGVVTDHFKLHNMVTRGTIATASVGDAALIRCYTNGTTENNNLKEWLDIYAAQMHPLETLGIPVIVRPLHEINGALWYVTPTPSIAINFYRYIFNYMVVTKSCHNLIWLHSMAAFKKNAYSYYPGGDVVDLVGIDAYPQMYLGDLTASYFTDYEGLKPTGKPFILGEFGPKPASGFASNTQNGHYERLLPGIRSIMPDCVGWISWSVGWSMMKQWNAGSTVGTESALGDFWTVNRDELPSFL